MPKAANAKSWSLQSHPDGTSRSYAYVAPATPGGPPQLSLAAVNGTTVGIGLTAVPQAVRSIVGYTVQRSLDQSSWEAVPTVEQNAPSEIPAQNTQTPTMYVSPTGSYAGNFAYTTIQAAFNVINPTDVLLIGPGTYDEAPVLTRSGTALSRIYIRCADYNNRPMINGNYTLPVGWGAGGQFVAGQAALLSIQARHVTIDGINVRDSARHGIIVGECANNGSFVASPNTFYEGVDIIR
jgi:hypothetical protein